MIVKNTEATILGIGVGATRLLPGNNTVDNKIWKEAKKNRLIKARLDQGLLVEIELEEKSKSDSFIDLTANDQKKYVSDLNDLAKLNDLKDLAKTDSVRTAIKKQIKKIDEA